MSTTMKVRARIAALLAAAAFGAAACGDSGSTTEPALQTKLQLANNSNVPIVDVVFARCTDEDRGPERLGAGETVGARCDADLEHPAQVLGRGGEHGLVALLPLDFFSAAANDPSLGEPRSAAQDRVPMPIMNVTKSARVRQ